MSPTKKKAKGIKHPVLPPGARQRLNEGIRDRFWDAWLEMERRYKRRVTAKEFGERVVARSGTKHRFGEPAIRKWKVYGIMSRDPDVNLAVALELGVHPGWLYWGLPPKELPYGVG
ncbi:MAG TPA: hypothetical protein VF178_07005 [Gemmatimonadaceae bacterium]